MSDTNDPAPISPTSGAEMARLLAAKEELEAKLNKLDDEIEDMRRGPIVPEHVAAYILAEVAKKHPEMLTFIAELLLGRACPVCQYIATGCKCNEPKPPTPPHPTYGRKR